jgi:uncharacterized membrane protein YjjP (DUF1212 family)
MRMETEMTYEARCGLVLAAAKALFVNGQSTEQTSAGAKRVAERLGLQATLLPRWGQLALQVENDDSPILRAVIADPTGVDMARVASLTRVIDDFAAGRLAPDRAGAAFSVISKASPTPTWLFSLAAAAGAAALGVIFGAHHLAAVALIAACAGAGALLRRGLAGLSGNTFLQPFSAALLAGVVGALAVRFDLSSSLRLVAVCPCMILAPGPHFLNGGLDLIRGRIHLGAARIVFASLVVVAICAGLLFGLQLFGIALPVDPPGLDVSLWQDVVAAGVAVAAYSIFFSTPLKMLPWPVAIGMLAHALRWMTIAGFGFGPVGGALVACLTVGLVLTPVADRLRMPFAAVGFASVVSMIPGVFLFRMASGFLLILTRPTASPALLIGTVCDGATAVTIVLAMCLGLLMPKLVIDSLIERAARKPA